LSARVAVVIPCFNDGELVREAVGSIEESEPVEIVVVDDASTDRATAGVLGDLRAASVQLIREPENRGPAAARTTGLHAVRAPYVFSLDADDLAVPGMLGAMADRLDEESELAVCFGDYAEFGDHESIVAVPSGIDPYRLAYTFEYPAAALFRRTVLESVGGWLPSDPGLFAYEDWHVWMSLAERGAEGRHMGPGVVTYRRRLHGDRLLAAGRRRHRHLYRTLRRMHPRLFADVRHHRRKTDLSGRRKLLYPLVYGGRPRFAFERKARFWLDRLGIWTLRR
jgi:glycosyltransferase involved in cell wall biosynthesis